MQRFKMFLFMITITSVFIIDGTFAGECRDYETCKKLAPAMNGTCDEIKSKWNATFACLTKSGACSDVAGIGVISGFCQGYTQAYEQKSNCTGDVCVTSANTPSFNTTKRMLCYQPAIFPHTCNETKYKLYHSCLKNAANDRFTQAIVQGMCENFRIDNGTTKCPFSLGTCTLVVFTTGTNGTTMAPGTTGTTMAPGTNGTTMIPGRNGTTMAPGTTVVGNSSSTATLQTTPTPSGAGMLIASICILINAAGVVYWSS